MAQRPKKDRIKGSGKKPAKRKLECNSKKLLALLTKQGWEVVRIVSTHHVLKHKDYVKLVTVPHPKKDLPIGTVKQIYKVAGLS